mmetsp:Transcript_8765/g.26354  ORF Transcript_8765/g.26354 Transcript_8765/m.26354 type:complete len:172 (-) Transcript_8765:1543-2058(-)
MGGLLAKPFPDLEVADPVDLKRYMGRWYEYGKYPNKFQSSNAECVTANYIMNDDGTVKVVNVEFVDGKRKAVSGKAWPMNAEESTAKLNVMFFWPFSAPYWVIQLDPDYKWAVVGEPSRTFLWILSREPELSDVALSKITTKLVEQGYDTEKIGKTKQKPLSEQPDPEVEV